MKLGGALTEVERDGTHLRCGGGARLPSVAGKTPNWGLAGLEFGVNIPGTVGGAVRMNANAYGGQLAEVLEWVEVTTAAGTNAETAMNGVAQSLQQSGGRGVLQQVSIGPGAERLKDAFIVFIDSQDHEGCVGMQAAQFGAALQHPIIAFRFRVNDEAQIAANAKIITVREMQQVGKRGVIPCQIKDSRTQPR